MTIIYREHLLANTPAGLSEALRRLPPGSSWELIEENDGTYLYLGSSSSLQWGKVKVVVEIRGSAGNTWTRTAFIAWLAGWGNRRSLEAATWSLHEQLALGPVYPLESPAPACQVARPESQRMRKPSFLVWARVAENLPLALILPMAVVSFALWKPAWALVLVFAWLSFAATELVPRRALRLRSRQALAYPLLTFGVTVVVIFLVGTFL